MSAAIPFAQGFLTLVAVGGTTFFGLWTPFALWNWGKTLFPGYKFRILCRDEVSHCLSIVTDAMQFDLGVTHELGQSLNRLSHVTLRNFKIDAPQIMPNDQTYLSVWYSFLMELEIYVLRGDLKAAREIKVCRMSNNV